MYILILTKTMINDIMIQIITILIYSNEKIVFICLFIIFFKIISDFLMLLYKFLLNYLI